MPLFCPHCDTEIEILGAPAPRPLPECEACGGVLEELEPDDDWEGRIDHPAVARRLTADFDRLFPVESR